jgi:hypothetical protein
MFVELMTDTLTIVNYLLMTFFLHLVNFINLKIKGVDINKQFGGQLKDFLKVLREKGECKIQFHIPPEVQEACSMKEKKIEFKTHKQLDEFIKTVDEHYPSFKSDYKDDFQLLKSFDRAFWLRHFRNPEIQDYQPLSGEIKGICECPFGDPISTNSYGGKVKM